jgi:hypothetical protein
VISLPALALAAAFVVLPPGSRLHERPDVESLAVALLDEETELETLDRTEGWLLVRDLGVTGWVREGVPYSLGRERGEGFHPGQRLDEELVAQWRVRLPSPVRDLRLGPVALVTDLCDAALADELVSRAESARARFAERFALSPLDHSGLSLVLFSRAADAPPDGDRACGRAGRRVALAIADEGSPEATIERVLHQAGHLAASAFFGDDLPPWLEEGLANALVEADRTSAPVWGGLAPLTRFWAGTSPCPPSDADLRALFAAGPELFRDDPDAACLRRDAADLVRFLSDAAISWRPWYFMSFLVDGAARYSKLDVPTLLEYLGDDLPSLERRLRAIQRRHRGSTAPPARHLSP